ncbi:hypothetical protein GJ689_23095 [Rhodoplanes serenus]|uniref:Phage tail assembly protein n=1 Tax=Rhodoplanes serenus TaxID=200615 RepID=A0A9X4XRB2_9BRAD|nr:hypothetical protein [Rhodoplanes serenus]MTW19089.1 hypothetical protein [Rhodoplanes serenus]
MSTTGKRGSATETVIDLDPEERAATTPVVVDEDPGDAAPAVVDEDAEDVGGSLPRRAVRHPDGSVTLPLRRPVDLTIRSAAAGTRSETYAALTFHRLAGGDLRAIAAASKETQPVVMLARAARLRQPIMSALFDRLDAADVADAVRVVESFFGSGPTTGR